MFHLLLPLCVIFFSIHSVLLAGGSAIGGTIHEERIELDRRSLKLFKARLSWYGHICIAGLGIFVEAFVIITTGQIKSIWSAQVSSK